MAIELKNEEQRKKEKQANKPKTKLEKARKVMFIFTIIFSVLSLSYFFVGFNPVIVVAPIIFFWVIIVLIPTIVTIGLIWTDEGYRNFASTVTSYLGSVTDNLPNIINALKIGLPYVGAVSLAIIASYGILSFLIYRKDKQKNSNLGHLIASIIIFVLVLLFFVLAFVFFDKVLKN